jgi:hypothetical protein
MLVIYVDYGKVSFFNNLKEISDVTNKPLDYIINFPGVARNQIIENYYSVGDNEMEFILVEDLLNDYNFTTL